MAELTPGVHQLVDRGIVPSFKRLHVPPHNQGFLFTPRFDGAVHLHDNSTDFLFPPIGA